MLPPVPFATTQVGSFPHHDPVDLCQTLVHCLDIPVWPQLPKRSFHENMYVQFAARFPGVRLDEPMQKIIVDTTEDLSEAFEELFIHAIDGDLDWFALEPDFAAGFYMMQDVIREVPGAWVKGQITGPFSFGLTVTDQNQRSILYDELLAEGLIKHLAMTASWQVVQLKRSRPNVLLCVDEPYLAAFGSAFVSLGSQQVIEGLNEVFAAINGEGAVSAVHCCGNTDWSMLLATDVNVLNLDAFGYLETLALYPAELRGFLDRGGVIAWGIVPSNEAVFEHTPGTLADRLSEGLALISRKAEARGISITPEELAQHSLLTPSCGYGPATPEIADAGLDMLLAVGDTLRNTIF